jgi:hypothetical protein
MLHANNETTNEFYFDYVRLLVENRLLNRSGYYMGASNQFVRLFTLTARRYWLAQATCEHLTADWKIHFSIRPRDLPLAFNLLAELYYNMKLPVGIKARYPDHWRDYDNQWPSHMHGREITVYILLYESTRTVKQTMLYSSEHLEQAKHKIDWQLSSTNEIYEMHDLTRNDEVPLDYYLDYIDRAERLLKQYRIQSNGCADGDYPIGDYTSVRNEKFVAIENENDAREPIKLVYPPNECGYNGAHDQRDLSKEIIHLDVYRLGKQRHRRITMFLLVLLVIGLGFFIHNMVFIKSAM